MHLKCSSHDSSEECCLGPKAWATAHQNWVATTTADCLTFRQKTPKHPIWHHSSNIPSATWWQTGYTDALVLWKGQQLILTGITHIPSLGLHSLLLGLSQHHYARVYIVFDPPTQDPAQHWARPKKPFYNNGGVEVSTWPWDALVPSQPSRSCRLTDGMIFWRCNRGCSFERKPCEHRPPVSVYSLNPWPQMQQPKSGSRSALSTITSIGPHGGNLCFLSPQLWALRVWILDREHLHHGI